MDGHDIRKFSEEKFHEMEQLIEEPNHITATSKEQIKVEKTVSMLYNYIRKKETVEISSIRLQREKHVAFLRKGLKTLSANLSCLDASRPWLVFWALHALELLDIQIEEDEASHIVQFLKLCQNSNGGFGGGPGQFSHLAPTYAAICALCIIGTVEAYEAINRVTLLKFLWKMRTEEGAFMMHESGEVDIRGVYCAVAVARMTNICSDELFMNTAQWVLRCQTYEGGFCGSPGLEAHGGYTYCGIAALTLLKHQSLCDTESLMRWAVNKQMCYEGGFQGRTNKLVDGCYSFWQGGLFPIIHSILNLEGDVELSARRWMFHQEALQEYLLVCCQYPGGGLIDKPGKAPDFYHTCYTLSGLSIAQHFVVGNIHKKRIVGHESNELAVVHILYNIGVESAIAAAQYFNLLPIPVLSEHTTRV